MARSVTDVAKMLSVMAGPDAADPLSVQVWSEIKKNHGTDIGKNGHVDYTKFLNVKSFGSLPYRLATGPNIGGGVR